jgi:hypothetical protein
MSDRWQIKGENDWKIDQAKVGEYLLLAGLLMPLTRTYRYCLERSVPLAMSRIGRCCQRRYKDAGSDWLGSYPSAPRQLSADLPKPFHRSLVAFRSGLYACRRLATTPKPSL